jgi:hypothetical protein
MAAAIDSLNAAELRCAAVEARYNAMIEKLYGSDEGRFVQTIMQVVDRCLKGIPLAVGSRLEDE